MEVLKFETDETSTSFKVFGCNFEINRCFKYSVKALFYKGALFFFKIYNSFLEEEIFFNCFVVLLGFRLLFICGFVCSLFIISNVKKNITTKCYNKGCDTFL